MDNQTRKKIELEVIFAKELVTVFNRIRSDYRVSFATNQPIRADVYQADVKTAVEKQYRRVQKSFQGEAGVTTLDEEAVFAALVLWSIQTANETAPIITDTTQRNFDSAASGARQALSDDGNQQPSSREIAAVAAVILSRIFANRVKTIATIETQRAAESTKLIEAYDASGLDPITLFTGDTGVLIPAKMKKQWFTVGDNRVRAAHRAANGQVQPVNRPYLVDGERLMYPGDTSLGASIGNIADCRCGSKFFKD